MSTRKEELLNLVEMWKPSEGGPIYGAKKITSPNTSIRI